MDLKPCPFCGGEPYFDHNDDGWTWIECDQCRVATNQRISAMEDCKPLLAEAWNRRAIPTEQRTCETCATGCLPNERVYVNPDAEDPCPGWTHRSPQSADVETVREAEKSYCIERVGANLYWGGSPMTGKYKGLDALVSISAAIRFARKEDAEMVRASQGMPSDEYVVTEHQWL